MNSNFLTTTSRPDPAVFANLKPGDMVWWHITASNSGEQQISLTMRVVVDNSPLASALRVTFGTCARSDAACGPVTPAFAGSMNELAGYSHELDPLMAKSSVTYLVGVTLPMTADK